LHDMQDRMLFSVEEVTAGVMREFSKVEGGKKARLNIWQAGGAQYGQRVAFEAVSVGEQVVGNSS